MTTFVYSLPVVNGSEDTWGATLNTNWTNIGTFIGALDSAELAKLDGLTASTAELNILDGLTASTAELNILDGLTASTAQLNYVAGVTSAVQTQINAKAALASPALSGNPTAPTQTAGNSTTKLATTAFVGTASAAVLGAAIGTGQTWSVVARTSGTSYRNTTGRPIQINVNGQNSGGGYIEVSTNASTWVRIWTGSGQANTWGAAIIPDDHYYKVGPNDEVAILS